MQRAAGCWPAMELLLSPERQQVQLRSSISKTLAWQDHHVASWVQHSKTTIRLNLSNPAVHLASLSDAQFSGQILEELQAATCQFVSRGCQIAPDGRSCSKVGLRLGKGFNRQPPAVSGLLQRGKNTPPIV